MRPPEHTAGLPTWQECAQVGDHQQENQQGDYPGFLRQRPQPFRPDHKSPERQTADGNRDGDREYCRESKIESSKNTRPIEKADAETFGKMVESDQREYAESPNDQR